MSLNDLVTLLAQHGIPATVDEDNDGQIVVYTGMKSNDGATLTPINGD